MEAGSFCLINGSIIESVFWFIPCIDNRSLYIRNIIVRDLGKLTVSSRVESDLDP